MSQPKGNLTAAQHEILSVVWDAGPEGVSIADIWQIIAQQRSIGRTTVLNQVDRLEKRGWLRRLANSGAMRFVATVSRDGASQQLVSEFVSDFFQGNAVGLVSALLGSDAHALSKQDIDHLRKILDQTRRKSKEDKS